MSIKPFSLATPLLFLSIFLISSFIAGAQQPPASSSPPTIAPSQPPANASAPTVAPSQPPASATPPAVAPSPTARCSIVINKLGVCPRIPLFVGQTCCTAVKGVVDQRCTCEAARAKGKVTMKFLLVKCGFNKEAINIILC